MKKLLSVLSSTLQGGVRGGLLFLLFFASVSAIYASNTQVGGIWYDFYSSTKTATVTYRGYLSSSYDGEYSGAVVIPETVTYNGTTYSVTSIGYDAFLDCSKLTSVTIPNSVTSIGRSAFDDCFSLTSITIPESVTSIGYDAFDGCYFLKENFINNSSLDAEANNYWDATFVDTEIDGLLIRDNTIIRCRTYVISATIPDNVTSIGDYAFQYCQSLISVTIPNSVTSIGKRAFYECSSLTSVTIPNSVTSIGGYAFYRCSSLTSITIGESVTSIGHYAFYRCSSLTSITIGESVTSIGNYAFCGCDALTSMVVESGNATYDSRENCNAIIETATNKLVAGCQNTIIPNSVTSIGNSAFYECSSLTSVTIPESVTSIGNYAFWGCSSLPVENNLRYADTYLVEAVNETLSTYSIKEGTKWVGSSAFSHCQSLTSIKLPNSVTSIGNSAFYECTSLTSVTIPNSVISIGERAFYYCSSLTSVTIGNSVTSIGEEAFYECTSLTSVTIPNSVTSIGDHAFYGCSSLTKTNYTGDIAGWCNIKFEDYQANPMYYSHNFYINDQEIKDLVIPNSVDSIHDFAFYGCSSLTSVTIGESVTSIGNYAFRGCSSLTSVTIPNSVTSIGKYAFYGCSSLTSITCEAATPPTIGSIYTFDGVSKSIPVYIPCGCIDAYKAASGWEDFTNIQEGLVEYSIEVNVNDTIMGSAKVDWNRTCDAQISAIPNIGYHFVQWNDGNTENPRTLELTQDTILTAEFAQSFSGQCGNSLYWELIETTLHITGSGEMYNYTSNTAPWKLLVSSINSLTIAEDVTSIGSHAFYDCYSLTSVTIPESVTSIGGSAFYHCSSLTSMTIPNSVKSIGDWAFYDCYSLTSMTIPNSVISIGGYAFCYCSSLTSVTIPNSVTSIGKYAFYRCSSLTSVTINSDAIVNKAYSSDSNISHIFGSQVTEYIIGESVTSIGDYAFYECSSLTSVTIPNSVTSIGKYAFYECSSLTSPLYNAHCFAYMPTSYSGAYTIPAGIEQIAGGAFDGCSSLTSVTIVESVTSIGEEAFYKCSSLTSVTIVESVTSIGEEAFYKCSSLTSVTINSDAIVSKAYSDASNISHIFGSQVTEYIIGDEVKSIGNGAFCWCSSLTSVTIGESVRSIGKSAFYKCSSLTSITCEAETPPNVGKYAFYDISTSIPVYVPCGCVEAYKAASGWKDFTNFQEPLAYSIEVNVNDTIMGTAKVDYNTFCEGAQISATPNLGYHFVQWNDGNTENPRTLELTQDTILTAEFAQSFSGQCGDNLYWSYDETTKTVSITGSGKMYDYTADTQPWLLFKEQIVEVTTTNTVTSIGTSAFEGCIRLGKVTLGSSVQNIAANAFADCTRLYDIYVYATYPPFAEESSFANYNVYVYIPCEYQRDYILDVVWGKFKFIECLESEDVTTDGNVTIVPGYNDVTITWPTEGNADTYTIVIKKGNEVFCTLTFNAEGQLLNIAFAPGRNGNHPVQYAEQAGNGYRFTVTGLTEATQYAYNITTKDAANKTIATYSGEFTTMGGTTTDMDNIQSPMTNCQKIIRNGQLLIFRDGVEYTIMGAEIK